MMILGSRINYPVMEISEICKLFIIFGKMYKNAKFSVTRQF